MKNIEAEEVIREKMKSMELRPWQKWVVSMMEFQGDRRVLFVVDEAGGLGKTWLTKWYHVNLQAAGLYNNKAWRCRICVQWGKWRHFRPKPITAREDQFRYDRIHKEWNDLFDKV